MANKQMKLRVLFDSSNKYSESMKSLANFFIENSSIFFEPNGEDAEYSDSISCNISTDFGIGNYDDYGRSMMRLCAKYEDLSDERFKPYRLLNASYASCTSGYSTSSSENGINNLTVKAITPGTSGNGYSIRIIINSSAPYRELELRKGSDVIGRGTLTSSMLEKYSSEMYYFSVSYANNLTFYNGEYLSNYVKLSGGGYCYFKRANGEGTNSAYIEVGPTTGGTDDISYNDIDYEISDYFGVLKCNTVLCKAKSNIKFYEQHGYDSNGNLIWEESTNFNIPITITPIISDSYVNDDDSVVPQSFDSNAMTVIDIANKDNRKYDFQLRTSSFTIGLSDVYNDRITKAYNLYYKVGICPIDSKDETRDKILGYLKHQAISITFRYNTTPCFTLDYSPWKNEMYSSSQWVGSFDFTNDSGDINLPTALTIPVYKKDYDNNNEFIAIMYAKLCNNDGSYFTQSIPYGNGKTTSTTFHVRTNENQRLTSNYYNENEQLAGPTRAMYLHFEDPNITGFIRSNEMSTIASGDIHN